MYFTRIIKKIKKDRKQLKILVLGLDNAGKTTILHRAFEKPIDRVEPTFGYQIHNVFYNSFNLLILDIGGQSLFREYWSNYYEKVDGVLFVFDSSDSRSFVEHIGSIRSVLVDTPVLIFANKCDLNPGFEIDSLGMDFCRFLAEKKDVHLVKCSGITGEGLEAGLCWIISRSMRNLEMQIKEEKAFNPNKPKISQHGDQRH